MPAPIESLDRSTLERRYRRMRLTATILGAASLLLVAALGSQSLLTDPARVGASDSAGPSAAGSVDGDAGASQHSPQVDPAPSSCPVIDRRDASDPRGFGALDAPIVLHEWTDFRCPYCGAFSRDTLPVLLEEYVDTGKVRLEIHDAALVGGENSVLIAVAARAAGEQDMYLEYYDAIYQTSAESANPKAEFTTEQLIGLAETVGVPDIASFTTDLSSEALHADVERETSEAQQVGVTGVPFFATSQCGQVTSGAQPVDSFRQILDTAIAQAASQVKQ